MHFGYLQFVAIAELTSKEIGISANWQIRAAILVVAEVIPWTFDL